MPDARRGVALAVLAGAAAMALLAGCGGIPSSGAVHAGAKLDGPPPVRVLAAPPVPGAQAAEIVRGFLRAQPGLDDDLAVARSYLGGELARVWANRPSVVVYPDESALHIVAGAGGTFRVSAPVDATVDASGIYTASAPGTQASMKLKVTRAFGQWRITSMDQPRKLWLTSYDLDRVYAKVPLYYAAAGTRMLVPDVRWFPATSGLATVVARAQLDPPPAYLRGAVATGIPSETRLAVDSVPTSGAVATIDLNSFARQPSQGDRLMLYAQLAASVAQTPGVEEVKVLVDGKVLDLPGQSLASGTTADALGYTIEPSLSAGGVVLGAKAGRSVLTQLSGDEGSGPSTQAALPALAVALRSLARSTDAREFAGVDPSGRSVVRVADGKTFAPITGDHDLTTPSYDQARWLWTVSSGAGVPTRVQALLTGPGVGAKELSVVTPAAPWLSGRQVTALRISRDGARALVTSVRRGVWRIDVAGVVRDAHGRPTSLSTPLRVGVGLTDVIDAAWVNSTTVIVLAKGTVDKHAEPYLVTPGAESVELPDVADPVRVAAGDNETDVYVVTGRGDIVTRGGSTGWVSAGHGLAVAFPG